MSETRMPLGIEGRLHEILVRKGEAVDWHKCNRGILCVSRATRTEHMGLGWRELDGPWHWRRAAR